MVDVEKEKIKGEEVHEEIQRIRYETALFHRFALVSLRNNAISKFFYFSLITGAN